MNPAPSHRIGMNSKRWSHRGFRARVIGCVWVGFGLLANELAGAAEAARGGNESGPVPTGQPAAQVPPHKAVVRARQARSISDEAAAVFRQSGAEVALRVLDRSAEEYLAAGGRYFDLNHHVWKEAQIRSGRENVAWSADLYDWLFRLALAHGNEQAAKEVVGVALNMLAGAHRYGRIKEILGWQEQAFARNGYNLDPTSYPDAGPGISDLPEVRHRHIPYVPPLGPRLFNRLQASAVHAMADDRERGGKWREALEWRLWVQAWAVQQQAQTPDIEILNVWFLAAVDNARNLESLELYEAAVREYDVIATHPWEDAYSDRSKIGSRLRKINCSLRLGDYHPEMEIEAREIAAQSREIIYLTKTSRFEADLIHARCLIASGNVAGGLAEIESLIAADYEEARLERCVQRLAAGNLSGVEADLVLLLESYRSSGRKIDEAKLYSLYAEFLEAAGRQAEAIAMRREAVRLMRGFDLFVSLPLELARLSVLLQRYGDHAAAAAAANEASQLASRKNRVPERVAVKVAHVLAARGPAQVAVKNDLPKLPLELQPVRAIVVPLEGRPLRGRLTLFNPTGQTAEGSLSFEGISTAAVWNPEASEVTATLGKDGVGTLSKIRVEPGSDASIELFAPASAVAKGTLTVIWSSAGQDALKSTWSVGDPEQGVASAIIDAGEFRGNPFFGIPIYHHHMQSPADPPQVNLRVTASVPTRIELYDASGRAVFVDANGDGSLGGVGDSLFSDENHDGAGDIVSTAGEADFGMRVYPPADLPAEGITLTVEVKHDGKWVVFATDRIIP